MYNEEELISNISYCASDFRSIFPQLLDTAKKLTNKWDPSLSNESDPGNILLKEAAIVGDKNNYHIDKNVLECFPLSATQQSTARQLYDLAGYNMHWYKSAYSNIQFTLLKSISDINNENRDADLNIANITLFPGTQVSDSTGEYVYSLLNKLTLSNAKETQSVKAIQGVIEQYEINGDYAITIDNLDENLRIYFPTNYIAENGIFVYDKDSPVNNIGYHNDYNTEDTNYWGRVDNLTQYKANSKIFKFGLDLDSDKCYIEFPEDVIDLIGNGLNIYYTITKGYDGNVKASVLNSLVNDIVAHGENDSVTLNKYLRISNNASIDGVNPESLQSAYKNYKKTIGTYDTLVSRRDYNNAIYNLKTTDETQLNLVSNAVVADRTSDINNSQSVMIREYNKNKSKNFVYESNGNKTLNSYDIILYLLKQPTSMLTIDDYEQSFSPDLSAGTLSSIEYDLDEFKSVQHDLQYINNVTTPNNPPYFDITNTIALNGTITTYYKVSKKEAEQIEKNVNKAIIENYNSRQLNFGEQIDYNELTTIIKNSDDRIRNIILDLPNYEPCMQYASDSTPVSLYKSSTNRDNVNSELVAKTILAGKVQLFNFLDDFEVDFGQTASIQTNNIEYITTENKITLLSNYYELKKNDIIQLVTPSFQTKATYSATVRYSYRGQTVEPNEIHVLSNTDELYVIYSENGMLVGSLIPAGTIIRPQGFELISTGIHSLNTQNLDGEARLKAGQSIDIVDLSRGTINGVDSSIYYYIVTNNIIKQDNMQFYQLSLQAGKEYILQQDEYFIYTSNNLNGFIALSSGTSLKCDQDITFNSKVLDLSKVYDTSYDDIYNEDENSAWNKLSVNLIRTDNDIITLTEGDKVKAENGTTLENNLNYIGQWNDTTTGDGYTTRYNINSSIAVIKEITVDNIIQVYNKDYTLDRSNPNVTYVVFKTAPASGTTIKIFGLGTTVTYIFKDEPSKPIALNYIIDLTDYTIQGRSTMLLNAGPMTEQTLVGNQKIKFNNGEFIQKNSNDKYYSFKFNYPLNLIGNDNLDVKILNETTGEYETLLEGLIYIKDNISNIPDLERVNGIITINTNATLNFTFNNLVPDTYLTDTTKPNNHLYDRGNSDLVYYLIPIQGHITASANNASLSVYTNNSYDGGYFSVDSIYKILGLSASNQYHTSINANETFIINDILAVPYNPYYHDMHLDNYCDNNLIFTFTNCSSQEINIGKITRVHNLNIEDLDTKTVANGTYFSYDILTDYANIKDKLKNLPGANQFDWTYRVPNINKVSQPLLGESYFNINHVYNTYTIPKIDLINSKIKVSSSNIIT